MLPVSEQFITDVENDNRNYQANIVIVFPNSSTLQIGMDDLWEGGLYIEESVSDDNYLGVGTAIINKCTIILNNIEEQFSAYDFMNATVYVEISLELTTNELESFRKGVYIVNEQNYDSSLVTLTCLDFMSKFDKLYSESTLTYPATLLQIVQDACTSCSVQMASLDLLNGSVSIPTRPTDTTLTFRNILEAVGQIACANARLDRSNRLEFAWYNKEALDETVESQKWDYPNSAVLPSLYTINTAMDDTVVTGVRAVILNNGQAVEYKTGVDGYYISIENNLFVTADNVQTILSGIASNILGFKYRKANFTHLSVPFLQAGDVAYIKDGHGRGYSVLVSTTIFTIGDRQTTVSAGSTPARNRANQYSQAVKEYMALPKPFYTWIAYATDSSGSNISIDPTGRSYIGFAENQTTETIDLTNPAVFTWSKFTGSSGSRGPGIYKVTTAPSSYTTTVGGFTPTYRISLATVKSQAGVTEVLVGDVIEYSYYHYPVGYVDSSYVYLGARTSIRGATGSRGATWYAGTGITGTSTTETIYPNSGVSSAIVNDHYLNTETQNVYRCTVAGAATAAKWVYEQNIKGDQGIQGATGQNGDSAYFHVKYSDDGGQTFTGNSGEDPGAYIGTYSDNNATDSTSVYSYTWVKIEGEDGAQGPQGIQGPQGESATIVSQSVSYCLSLSGTDPSDISRITESGTIRILENGEIRELEEALAPWQSEVPGYEPDTYLWSRTQIEYSDGTVVTSYTVSYNQPKVESVVSEYYLSTSDTTQSDGFWSETPAEYIDGRYYWKRDKTTWNNGTIEYSDPVLEQNMISAHEEASDAKKIATNYMSSDNTGIMVADLEDGEQTPSTATGRNVRITNTAVEVRDGQDVKASFGTEVVLGDTNESKLRLGDTYIRAQDSDDNEYYEVQDLRGETITARFLGTEVRRYNNACPLYYASEIVSVTVGGIATTAYTLESDGSILYLTNDPQDNDIVIVYKTSSTAPAFTFGTRGNEAQGIFSATFGQDNIASALHSFASGHATEATQECASAEGAYSKASGYASHAQNYGTVAPNAYETAIGKYNKAVDSPSDVSTILFYIGNGTDETDRHNALTVDENGNIETNEVQSILSKLSNSLSAVDLNDITEPGNYSVAASTAITNTPFSTNPAGATSPAFSLMVFNSRIVTSGTSETVVLQVAWSKDAGAVRARIYQSLTWSAWQTLMSTSQPTFSRNTTNTSAVTISLERVGDMVIGSFRATTRIQFTASTTYSLGTLSPVPVANSVFFVRSGDVFNVQGWVGVSDGALYVQSGTALATNKTIEGMFIYHPVH